MSEQKVLCPWCGREMHLFCRTKDRKPPFWYNCPDEKCFGSAPVANTPEEALAAALRRPIRKLLTLKELTKSAYQIPCWIECFGREDLQADVIDRDSVGMFSRLITHGFTLYYDPETYGKVWRCWTSRPTDEERAAAPWEV